MDKGEVLRFLNEARKAHVKWVQHARLLIEGIPVEKEAIPLNSTECKFGVWFYDEGQKLAILGNMGCLGDIEKAHFTLHEQYLKIFKIYFSETDRSFFVKIFSSKHKVTDHEKELAHEYYIKLQATSEELLNLIGRLERRLYALPQSAFDAIVI